MLCEFDSILLLSKPGPDHISFGLSLQCYDLLAHGSDKLGVTMALGSWLSCQHKLSLITSHLLSIASRCFLDSLKQVIEYPSVTSSTVSEAKTEGLSIHHCQRSGALLHSVCKTISLQFLFGVHNSNCDCRGTDIPTVL